MKTFLPIWGIRLSIIKVLNGGIFFNNAEVIQCDKRGRYHFEKSKKIKEEKSDNFQNLPLIELGLPNDSIYRVLIDKQNNLWIETAGGVLHKLVIATFELTKYKHEIPHQPYYRYHSIYEDTGSHNR